MILCLAGCGGGFYTPPVPLPSDDADIPEPEERNYWTTADLVDKQITEQISESLDLSRQLRNITGRRKQAYNVDPFGEVPNSTWFTNRNHINRLTAAQIARGPDTGTGPDMDAPWTITRAKSMGVTPGFTIRDSRGDHYLIKFDPPGYGELVTGAEVVSTKLFYAAGYNVPENYIVRFHAEGLKLGDRVVFKDDKGRKRDMTAGDLAELLDRVEQLPDGTIRAVASRYLPGKPKGPFKYSGFRRDDANDIVPHQHRRELRGLRVIAAWLNHVDTKSGNSLDVYIEENGRRFIRHFLIDFGTTLGSAAHGPFEPSTGHVNQVDPHAILANLFTVGLHVKGYERLPPVRYPSAGLYDAKLFNPGGFKFNVPNPAFSNCTDVDGYWGAKIVMSFTDEQLEVAVAQGRYTDPAAAYYILDTLKKRRDATGRYWFGRVNPLDRFMVECEDDGRFSLSFDDLAIEAGFEQAATTSYRYESRVDGRAAGGWSGICSDRRIPLPSVDRFAGTELGTGGETRAAFQLEVTIETRRGDSGDWSDWVKIYLDGDPEKRSYTLLGLRRED